MSYNVFAEQLHHILAVTKALNGLDEAAYTDEHHWVQVRLVQQGTGVVVGKWSDEIGPGSWSFEFLDKIGEVKA